MALLKIYRLLYIIGLLILSGYSLSFSQSGPLRDGLLKATALSDKAGKKLPVEKVYLQFDKPYYALGDTIWFKAYLLNSFLRPSDKSRIINIDIANDSNKVIKQYRLPVEGGLSWGNISLDEKEGFATGTYTIRAYTNWMRNFGDSYFFYKSFYISSANENNLLVNTLFNTSRVNGSNILTAKLLFSTMDNIPFAVRPLQLQVMSGNRHLYKQKLQTGVDGILNINFNIPEKPTNLVIVAESGQKDKKAVIPIPINRAENTDVQFLSEGGNLVAGLPAHICFKAIGEDGKGVQISGIIIDHNQQQVTEFKPLHNGMGSFDMEIKAGEIYSAKVTLPNGSIKNYPLPVVKSTGLALRVTNPLESDSLAVSVASTDDVIQHGGSYFLIGKARGIVCYAAIINFNNGNYIKRKIAKSLFPTGITHFTIMTTNYQPLNERMVFINHHDNLDIKFTTNKPDYHSRDSVALKIKVTDNAGNPVVGSFSLAVTDDAQVKTDSLNSDNILTRMLLTSDLNGYVEGPGYYLSSNSKIAWQALDNLLLTQGWTGYYWGQVFNPPAIAYQPEKEFMVKGSVFNVFNKPVKGTDVLLFSKSPSILMDTVTDKGGNFVFDRFPHVDTPIFVLKAVNKHGKSFNVGIRTDDIQPPVFTKPFAPTIIPWYVNSDSTLLNYTKNDALKQQTEYYKTAGHLLKEVKITSKKIIKGSQNLNGPGNADIVLDEKDLEAAGKKTWLQLFQERIKGFRIANASKQWAFIQDLTNPIPDCPGQFKSGTHEWYFINDMPVKIYVDGMSVNDFQPTSVCEVFSYSGAFQNITNFLNTTSAEDITGMEVSYTDKYGLAYISTYGLQYKAEMWDAAFIEITTRSGHGVVNNTPGMYLYKPLPISWPKQFYKPKYTVKDTAKHLPDLRSTIDWEPNIVTGINGEAKVFFYTADKPSTYTVTIEGLVMNGGLGYKLGKIVVKGE